MKVHKYGTVILTTGPIRVEGWDVERELTDPEGATAEQLLLDFAVNWAQAKLSAAIQSATLTAFMKQARQKMLEKSLPKLVQ